MTGHRISLKGHRIGKDGKIEKKPTYARTIAAKKAQRTKQRFMKAARGINRP